MPITTLIATVTAYVLIAILLISLNLTSRWRWWIKGGAIVITTLFFAGSYLAINSMLGWPTTSKLPPRFSFLWSKTIEPDKFTGAPGYLYLWVEELDENNVPSGRPRGYELPYTPPLADAVEGAQDRRDKGEEVMGSIEQMDEQEQADANQDKRLGPQREGEQNAAADTVPFMEQQLQINFQDLPPVALPDKGPL